MQLFCHQQFAHWSGFFPLGHVPGDSSWDSYLGNFVAQDNSRGANGTCRFTEIGCYFCTYDDIYFISSYTKGCVRYGIFLYIRLHYVPQDCPRMSRGTLVSCGILIGCPMVIPHDHKQQTNAKICSTYTIV